ncbi:DUF2946 domain-containing protein [Burkholderia alba]|uniref:DUF2946 domain-containing protein n=1 Tax=Burkholderia alba TaxID=2683677 RepID=UPI002B05780D|nr:DUF2946 domain-containing protein [Burkholderia alba]
MKRTTRWMSLLWLALVLNVLSPVIGYARLAASPAGLFTLELCSAAGAKRVVVTGDTDRDGAPLSHANVPHCVYCPGFAANVALGGSVPELPVCVRAFAYTIRIARQPVYSRRGVRIAQPRAPPDLTSI